MKSPVRENCTPGSVRGLSGNWQSYRDLRGETVSGAINRHVTPNEVKPLLRIIMKLELSLCLANHCVRCDLNFLSAPAANENHKSITSLRCSATSSYHSHGLEHSSGLPNPD